jgi:hypothetical protein
VSVIDTATNTVVATVPVGTFPSGVAITPIPVTFAYPLGQGFWKNHPDAWPVTSLTLGSQTYTQADLLTLFDTPPRRRDDAGDSVARGQRGAWSDAEPPRVCRRVVSVS